MSLPAPVVVVPGITASTLEDQYEICPELVWSVMSKSFERIRLHPDDVRYEAEQPARIVPGHLFEVAYKELIHELRHNLTERKDQPVPVYPFAYDWRQPLERTEAELAMFVEEVVARTKLMRHYARAGYVAEPVVNLVGHSMGGLIIAGYLASSGGRAPVGKVATLASPFRGSFEAVIKTVTGTANLGTSGGSSREREAARVTPGLYHLTPSMKNGLVIEEGLPKTLYDSGLWQPSILATIADYVGMYAAQPGSKKDQAARAVELLEAMLGEAQAHRKKIESMKLGDCGLEPEDWMAVVGVDAETRVQMRIARGSGGKPEFVLSSKDRMNRWAPKAPAAGKDERVLTGDGTVPFEGAVPGFLERERLICVTPDDYGYWELDDRVLTRLAGFHGILPNMDLVHRLIVRHFTGRSDRHGNTWGHRAPGVAEGDWTPPIRGLRDKDSER